MPKPNETFGNYCGARHPTDSHRSCVILLTSRVHKTHRTIDGQTWPVARPAVEAPDGAV